MLGALAVVVPVPPPIGRPKKGGRLVALGVLVVAVGTVAGSAAARTGGADGTVALYELGKQEVSFPR